MPLVAACSGPDGGSLLSSELTPQRQKQLPLQALVDQLESTSAAHPVLLAYEDVHWIDPTTLELLGLAIERIKRLSVLLLITFRPEFNPPWSSQPHISALALARLGRREGAAMVDRVAGGRHCRPRSRLRSWPRPTECRCSSRSSTKTVLESGLLQDAGDHWELAGRLPPLAIPATLHDSLLARLDRLGPAKEIAQIGAALGREFGHAVLAAVADRPDAEVQCALDQLVAAELIFRRGAPPNVTYSFKHALVQDAAYGTLLKSRRQHLHTRIAQVLEERFPETAEVEPELLAYHCREAGLAQAAAAYRYQAGKAALRRSAVQEAVEQLCEGLETLESLPSATERIDRNSICGWP